MSTINHPSMKRAGGSSVQNKPEVKGPQTYIVDDAMQNLDDHLQQFNPPVLEERPFMPSAEMLEKAREVPVKEPESPKKMEDRKKLENILFMGRLSKVLEIADHKFEICTLTHREQTDIMKSLMNFADGADLFTIRTLTLANALKSIDGVKLDDMDVFSEEEEKVFASKYSRRTAIVDNMQLGIVEKIYDEYNKLLKENDSLIAGENIKK